MAKRLPAVWSILLVLLLALCLRVFLTWDSTPAGMKRITITLIGEESLPWDKVLEVEIQYGNHIEKTHTSNKGVAELTIPEEVTEIDKITVESGHWETFPEGPYHLYPNRPWLRIGSGPIQHPVE